MKTRAESLLLPALLLILPAVSSSAFDFCAAAVVTQRIVVCKTNVDIKKCRAIAEKAGCSVVRELPSINAIVITIAEFGLHPAESQLLSVPEVARVDRDPRVNWIKGSTLGKFAHPRAEKPAVNARPAALAAELPWGVRRVNASAAWSRGQGQGVKVAVIDTGIDRRHPDLPNVAGGANVVDPENPGDYSDAQGHGTHVAGTIGASGSILGVAPGVSLYAVRVLDAEGNGAFSDVIAGIEWAVANGMHVANMSLGADEDIESLHLAVIAAKKAGLTIVAAAGNDGASVSYPGAYPEVITVGTSDKNDKTPFFSSRGPSVDFAAPGVEIKSTVPGGSYVELTGTSMSAPHVTGLAALAVGFGAFGKDAVQAALRSAATRLPEAEPTAQGFGMIDAGRIRAPRSLPNLREPALIWPWGLSQKD